MTPLTQAERDVIAERRRQVSEEGWTPEHDDQHTDGSIARAASAYAYSGSVPEEARGTALFIVVLKSIWPRSWSWRWWKPKNRRRDLVRSCALGLAEIERLDRAAERGEKA